MPAAKKLDEACKYSAKVKQDLRRDCLNGGGDERSQVCIQSPEIPGNQAAKEELAILI